MHRDAEPGEAEPGVAASPGGGIYKPVRTDHHEPLGSGGAGEKSDSSEEEAAAALLQKSVLQRMEKKA